MMEILGWSGGGVPRNTQQTRTKNAPTTHQTRITFFSDRKTTLRPEAVRDGVFGYTSAPKGFKYQTSFAQYEKNAANNDRFRCSKLLRFPVAGINE
jgi:hypothetical protein